MNVQRVPSGRREKVVAPWEIVWDGKTSVRLRNGSKLFGFDADLELKRRATRDVDYEMGVIRWLEKATGHQVFGADGTFEKGLESGVALCKLVNIISPKAIPQYNTKALAFAYRDNYILYNNAVKSLGLGEAVIDWSSITKGHFDCAAHGIAALARHIDTKCPHLDLSSLHDFVAVNTAEGPMKFYETLDGPTMSLPKEVKPPPSSSSSRFSQMEFGVPSSPTKRQTISDVVFEPPQSGHKTPRADTSSRASHFFSDTPPTTPTTSVKPDPPQLAQEPKEDGKFSNSNANSTANSNDKSQKNVTVSPRPVPKPRPPPLDQSSTVSVEPPKPVPRERPLSPLSSPKTEDRPVTDERRRSEGKKIPAVSQIFPTSRKPSNPPPETKDPPAAEIPKPGNEENSSEAPVKEELNGVELSEGDVERVRGWVERMTGTKLSPSVDGWTHDLRSGILLCQIANACRPASTQPRPGGPLTRVENTWQYLRFCQTLGIPTHRLFQPADLSDTDTVSSVIPSLLELSTIFPEKGTENLRKSSKSKAVQGRTSVIDSMNSPHVSLSYNQSESAIRAPEFAKTQSNESSAVAPSNEPAVILPPPITEPSLALSHEKDIERESVNQSPNRDETGVSCPCSPIQPGIKVKENDADTHAAPTNMIKVADEGMPLKTQPDPVQPDARDKPSLAPHGMLRCDSVESLGPGSPSTANERSIRQAERWAKRGIVAFLDTPADIAIGHLYKAKAADPTNPHWDTAMRSAKAIAAEMEKLRAVMLASGLAS
eukprot:comp13948_c1_seq1/m.9721 comp13948_c1_seq1/g.9721  ORF comp13948_c1_seq1/g.9721 comp13948_c1_seq1/m.9721 type:complete len:770 (-) comp13948_c1_seq1:127-2436(-)